MKTAMQELLENLQKQFDEQKFPIVIDGTKYLEKEKEQIEILINALERIKDWDDEMHSEWDDCGEFAKFTLETYNQNK